MEQTQPAEGEISEETQTSDVDRVRTFLFDKASLFVSPDSIVEAFADYFTRVHTNGAVIANTISLVEF